MKVLVSEYILSTFHYDMNSSYLDLLPEAYAITLTLANSMKLSGFETYLTVSSALPQVQWDKVVYVKNKSEYYDIIKQLRSFFDWIVLIAPPLELIKTSKLVGNKLLGPPTSLIELFSDKYLTYIALKNCGVRTPRTLLIKSNETIQHIEELNPPYVVKPVYMAGSECVYLAENEKEALKYAKIAMECDPSGKALVQEYINGIHGSLSVIYGEKNILLYSVNLQLIVINNNKFEYVGGVLPVRNNVIVNEAGLVLNKLLKCYSMLRGYVGLDVVWNNEGLFIIEANPRPTTSIIGINEVFPNIGGLMVDSMRRFENNKTKRYLGDLSDEYVYYLISQEQFPRESSEKIIFLNNSNRIILIGKSNSKTIILNKIQKLLSNRNLAYDINYEI